MCLASLTGPSSGATGGPGVFYAKNPVGLAKYAGTLDLRFSVSIRIWGLKVPGQQLMQPADPVLGDIGQDMGQPGLRVDIVHLGADDQALHHCGCSAYEVTGPFLHK
jgi:hypothetical protein